MAGKREDLDQLEMLVLQHLLSAMRDPTKPPRASMIGAALTYLKASKGDLTVPSQAVEEGRERLRSALSTSKLPFLTPEERAASGSYWDQRAAEEEE